MEDWSLPDNSHSNSLKGMVGNDGYWSTSSLNPLGIPTTNHGPMSSTQQPLPFASGQQINSDINEDIEKLFQQTFTLQQQEQHQHQHQRQQQQQQQQQQQRWEQHTSCPPIQPSYHSQSSSGQPHLPSPSSHPSHVLSQGNPSMPTSNRMHTTLKNYSASPTVASSRKRSLSSTNIDQATPPITADIKARPFTDMNSMTNNHLMTNAANTYNMTFRPPTFDPSPLAPPPPPPAAATNRTSQSSIPMAAPITPASSSSYNKNHHLMSANPTGGSHMPPTKAFTPPPPRPQMPIRQHHPQPIINNTHFTTGSPSSLSASTTIPKSSSPISSPCTTKAPPINVNPSQLDHMRSFITPHQPSISKQQQHFYAPAPIVIPDPPHPAKPVLQPRPQLRLHITKRRPQSPRPCVKDDKDPMKPELDILQLRRLTVAILRTLGVTMAVEDLPTVDVDRPLSTDSEQVLPAAAMQLITAMILGTSGDKEVSQTMGSQICNGDLVALQRMIVAGLKSRNIVIHTVQTSTPLSSPSTNSARPSTTLPTTQHSGSTTTASNANEGMSTDSKVSPPKPTFDLTAVTFQTPTNVTRLFLRLYRFILNILLSTPDCWPFIQPVPVSAVFYHQEVKYPMDLSTIERNMWNGLYTRFAKFEQDMQLIWKNAKAFHRNAGAIPKHAENLEALFYKVISDLKKQIRKPLPQGVTCEYKFDTSDSLPEESDFSYPPMKQVFSKRSVVYGISAISPMEPKAKKPKGLTYDKQLYIQLNGPFFQSVERMKEDPFGNHSPVPRFYIAKNRTLLRQVRAQGVLAIFYNTKTTRTASKMYQVETDMVLAYPASPLFDIDQTDDFAPKGWIHLRPLKVLEKLVFSVNETIERDYFRRMFATFKFMVMDDNSTNNRNNTKRILKKMVQQILGLPEEDDDDDDDDDQMQYHDGPSPIKYSRKQQQQQRRQKIQQQRSQKSPASSSASPLSSRTLLGRATAMTFKHENGQVSPSGVDMDDGNNNSTKNSVDLDTWSEGTQSNHQTSAIKKEKRDPYFSSSSLSTPEDKQRSTLSPDSISSVVSPQTKALETVIPTIPLSPSRTSEMLHPVWQKLLNTCTSKGADLVNVQEKYGHLNWSSPDSEGFFKQVYFLEQVVVQTFRQMTMYQRITEVACLMKLRNLPHMAQLREVLHNDNGDITGLSMERYQRTLKQYTHTHSHHRLSAYQKYDIIYQMLDCMKTIHKAGLAHRDLSEVNIMVNTIDGELEDGSSKICLYLIDFGKAVFCDAYDLREWFVDVRRSAGEYDGDVVPETEEELNSWCESLPWVKGKPDHGYRMYRSIQTLPKTRSDTQILPWLIHPQSEDVYSIGVMIWKIFTETEPWRGILDTDLQGLRYVAEDDYRIQRALEHEVHGELSRQLLMKCLRTRPQDRWTAADILDWCGQDNVRTGLLNEWKMYSSETRATRKVKSMYGFDDNDKTATPTTCTDDTSKRTNKRTKRSTPGTNQASKSRGRLKKHGSIEVNLDA